MITLGISAYYHDSAVAILQDEKIIFALQEERLSRKKADDRFPSLAIKSAFSYLNESHFHTIRGGGESHFKFLNRLPRFCTCKISQ